MPSTQGRETGEVRVTLPFPVPGLSPNSRLHWAQKSKLVKTARRTAWGLVLAAKMPLMSVSACPRLEVEFRPPDARRRDLDNCIASFKASNDGISDALGVDDSRFISTYRMGEPVKGGAVLVTISQIESEAERFKRLEPQIFAGIGKGRT